MGFSAKYEWAHKWAIPIVREEWISESFSAGRLLMPRAFEMVLPDTNDLPFSLSDLNVCRLASEGSLKNDTALNAAVAHGGGFPQYLIGCRILLGEQHAHRSRSNAQSDDSDPMATRVSILRRLIVMAGGLRMARWEGGGKCTHWIVSRQMMTEEGLENLCRAKAEFPELFVVHERWLVDCFQIGGRLDESLYLFDLRGTESAQSQANMAANSQATTLHGLSSSSTSGAAFRMPTQRRSLSLTHSHQLQQQGRQGEQDSGIDGRENAQPNVLSRGDQAVDPGSQSKMFGTQVKRTLGTKLSNALSRLRGVGESDGLLQGLDGYESSPDEQKGPPLRGCTVAVSSRLWHRRTELHRVVTSLGGSFVYSLDRSCSHLLHLGMTRTDCLREIEQARSQGTKVVSPDWIFACEKASILVPEANFPYHSCHLPGDRENLDESRMEFDGMTDTQRKLSCLSTQGPTNCVQPNSLPRTTITRTHESLPDGHYERIKKMADLSITGALLSPSSQNMCNETQTAGCDNDRANPQRCCRFFCFTGLSEQDKRRGSHIVEELGGEQAVLESPSWDPRVTHLVSGRPSRSEKYLAAMASGAWILDIAYLEGCLRAGSFDGVSEEEYELVGSASHQPSSSGRLDLVDAGRRWRRHLVPVPGRPAIRGAFTGWRVMLASEEKRREGFVRLLLAGGANVSTPDDPVLPDPRLVTHVLLSSQALRSRLKNEWLVHVEPDRIRLTDFIADFLLRPP